MPGDVAQRRRRGEAVVAAAGRLALEVEDEPAGVDLDHLGEVEVAVDADLGAGVVEVGARRARRARTASTSNGAGVGDARRPRRAPARIWSTHPAGVAGLAPPRVGHRQVEPGDDGAEAGGVGREVAAALLGRQARREHVAHRGARELPALGGADEEVAEHREVDVVAAQLGERREHVLVAALGQHPGDLHVGVRAGLDLAEHLEDDAPRRTRPSCSSARARSGGAPPPRCRAPRGGARRWRGRDRRGRRRTRPRRRRRRAATARSSRSLPSRNSGHGWRGPAADEELVALRGRRWRGWRRRPSRRAAGPRSRRSIQAGLALVDAALGRARPALPLEVGGRWASQRPRGGRPGSITGDPPAHHPAG